MTIMRQLVAWLLVRVDEIVDFLLALGPFIRPSRNVEFFELSEGALSVRTSRPGSPWRKLNLTLQLSPSGDFVQNVDVTKLISGASVEIVLRAERFISRPLELPRQASKFIEGIVRAQIDRLAPWPPAEVVFGFSEPVDIRSDRISVLVTAAPRARILPVARAVAESGAHSVVISVANDATSSRIRLFEQQPNVQRARPRARAAVIAVPLVCLAVAVIACIIWAFLEPNLETRRVDLVHKLAQRRSSLTNGQPPDAPKAEFALVQKKRETPPAVLVIDTLSKALPDDTYLTELRIEDRKLQISGMTRDAASLVPILEQTRQFSHATFFAPTTRNPMERGERFHIEAHIDRYFQ